MHLQSVGMLSVFFKRWRNVSWIEPRDLQQLTDEFVKHVETMAEKNNIPLLSSTPGESHVDEAAPHLAKVADRDRAIYCIIKVQEETSSFVSYVPKNDPKGERKIARGRRRVNHFYFFIKDPEFGVGNSIRISSYAPFPVTLCCNGHNFVAQQLTKKNVSFKMRDNLFVEVGDAKAFHKACLAFTAEAIEAFLNRWVYRCIPLFTAPMREDGYGYAWYLDQVERCHNLIFRDKNRLNALFGRLLDKGRAIGQPHIISRLFQRRVHASRTGGRMQRTLQEDYCLKAWHKKTYIKQYNKQDAGLRTETSTHDVREFGTKKGLHNLSYLLHCMDLCNQRLLRWQDTIDETTVASGFIEKLGQPTIPEKGQRVAGIRLDSQRLTWVMAAVLQFAHVITGFRSRELRTYLQNRFGLSPDEYSAAQIRYDLVKLRAKGWISKLDRSTRYVLTPKGMTQGTAVHKLKRVPQWHDCGALGRPTQGRLAANAAAKGVPQRTQSLAWTCWKPRGFPRPKNQNKLSKIIGRN